MYSTWETPNRLRAEVLKSLILHAWAMKLEDARRKVERIVRAIEDGKIPYRVVQAVLYGSAAKGDANPQDVDIYLQLDQSTIPYDDVWIEVTGQSGGFSTRLRRALKATEAERVSIQWGSKPWEEHRMAFPKLEDVEITTRERIAELDPSFKSHARARARLKKSAEKRQRAPTEWPPFGVVIYPRGK